MTFEGIYMNLATWNNFSSLLTEMCETTMWAAYPTTNGGVQNGSSVGIGTRCMHVFLHVLGADLHAQSVLVNKISASELSRKFIKNALLVGYK